MNRTLNEWVVLLSWLVLILSIVMWPVSMATWAKNEPPTVVSLGFLGLIIPQVGVLLNAYVKKDVES